MAASIPAIIISSRFAAFSGLFSVVLVPFLIVCGLQWSQKVQLYTFGCFLGVLLWSTVKLVQRGLSEVNHREKKKKKKKKGPIV